MKSKVIQCRIILLFILAVIFGIIAVVPVTTAFADSENSILDDFAGTDFSIIDYPSVKDDYSLDVIQIAETTDNRLVVYVYQPSAGFKTVRATSISLSLHDSENGESANFRIYNLSLIGSEKTIYKYILMDFIVSDNSIRYYEIAAIYRLFIIGVDIASDNEGTINEIAFNVGKRFKAKTENGVIHYGYDVVDTIEIIDPFGGYIEYFNGYKFCTWSHCHSHFVAFSTDREIDFLFEASLTYYTKKCYKHYSMTGGAWTSEDKAVQEYKTVKGTEKGENEADGFKGKKYTWERIQTVNHFIESEDLTETVKKSLEGKQWVLRFLETPYIERSIGVSSSDSWTQLSNITILRLKFITDGKVYDLGAVSNKVTGSDKPSNNNIDETASFLEWLARVTGIPEWVWILILVVLILAICLPVLSLIFPVFGQVLAIVLKFIVKAFKYLFKGLWWLICLPFKGIAALVNKIKERRAEKAV